MAGGFGSKDPKNNKFNKSGLNNEILKFPSDYDSPKATDKTPKFSLNGILNLGQTIDFNKTPKSESSWKNEFLPVSHLQKETTLLLKEQQSEIKKSIDSLKSEIQNLIQSAKNLDENIETVALQPVVEANDYHLNVLQRLKKLIMNFTLNISEASVWLNSFKGKRQKHNAFWNKVKNKKSGGEQYLFSSEHSSARSVN